jgi:GNAT superfamily N-acetyltransferase
MRRAVNIEAEEIAHLYLSARKNALGNIPPVFGTDERVLVWLSTRISSGEECWVAEDDLGICAFMLLEPGWLDQLYVRPDRIGQGIGSKLVDKAKDLMPNGLKLWTFQSNLLAHKFYERHGFLAIEQTDGTHNEERSPDVCYEWKPK